MKIGLLAPCSQNAAKGALIWPPLGLCRIARYLADRGHEVRVIEDSLDRYPAEWIVSEAAGLEVLGIGAMTLQAPRAEAIIAAVRAAGGPPIVCGGPHYGATRRIPAGAAAIVVGDGEGAMLEFCDGRRGVIQGHPVREYVEVDFSPIDYARYGDHLIDGTRAISLLTARGCPFDCKFCGSPAMFGRSVTAYPLVSVVDNMARLSQRHGLSAFRIMDDTFTSDRNRVRAFCELARPHHWRMSCLTNVRTIDEAVLEAMCAAGFEFVAVGAESGDDRVLRLAGKRQTREQIAAAVAAIRAAGMKAEVLFMIGLPGETKDSLASTIDFAAGLGAYRVHAQFFTPFPGCEFYDRIDDFGRITDPDYARWTHRAPVFVPHTISRDDLTEGGAAFFAMLGREIGK